MSRFEDEPHLDISEESGTTNPNGSTTLSLYISTIYYYIVAKECANMLVRNPPLHIFSSKK